MSKKTAMKRLQKKKSDAKSKGKKLSRSSGSGGLSRKIRRKAFVGARKQFMREFKDRMATFKMQVKCSACERPPHKEENIDNWRINKSSENIDLICTDCYTEEESEGLNESTTEDFIV